LETKPSSRRSRTLPPGRLRIGGERACRPIELTVAAGPDPAGVGQAIVLTADETRLGREPQGRRGAFLPLNDASVSRVHARITARPETRDFLVTDCASSNGMFVNGRAVQRHVLRAGDVIRLGDTVLVAGEVRAPQPHDEDLGLAGESRAIADLRTLIRRVGASQLPAMIVGPTGTGKELVARALHQVSGRRGPFLAVNCAALPGALVENALFGHKKGAYTDAGGDQEGAFVRADGGTLFLDEIGDLSLEAQPKLLRALETREVLPVGATVPVSVDLRIVVATHVSLDTAAGEGRFREDLYARLAGVVLKTPFLVEHKDDLLSLLRRFLPEEIRSRPMDPDFVEALLIYAWPRNVRELQMLAERLQVLYPGARFELGMLEDEMAEPVRRRQAGPRAEKGKRPTSREELMALLDHCGGNVARLAKLLQRNRKQVYRWMDDYQVARGSGRSPR